MGFGYNAVPTDFSIAGCEKSGEETMKAPAQSVEFEFIASANNFLYINCKRCGGEAEIEYRGLDPVMPQILAMCRKCGSSVTFKITNPGAMKGFHAYPAGQVWDVNTV